MTEISRKKRIHARKDMICIICAKLVSVPFYRQVTFKCCSRKCTRAYQMQLNQHVVECVVCKKMFSVVNSRKHSAKYCSNACKGTDYHNKRGNARFECAHCGTVFFDAPSHKRKYCSRACVNKVEKAIWRATITAARDNIKRTGRLKKCERCGFATHPEILGVHHKDRDRNNNTPDNLEVLCPNCHSLEHKKHVAHAGHKFSH